METWKSSRKVEEEIRDYRRQRFETYMGMVDDGILTEELALAAFREEDTAGLWASESE